MNFTTRKPSGRASWPFIVLAGVEGGGKTWAAAEATGMEQVDRAFFIELGEGMADEYGNVPGADFEIIEHDGTVGMIREAIAWAAQQPAADGKHNMLVFDSLSELWALLSDNAQQEANRRQKRKGRNVPEDGAQVTMDLWNRATEVWEGIMAQLQRFPGPVIGTARLEVVTIMDEKGQPTKHKDWKIQAQKRLPYRAQVIVQARAPRQWTMTKIATTVPELQLEPGREVTFDDFSVAKLLTKMGVGADTAASTFQTASTDDSLADNQPEQARSAEKQPRRAEDTGRERKAWLAEQARKLLETEKAGDVDKVRAVEVWARNKGDAELEGMANQTVERMEKAKMNQAQESVQQELGAEIVEGEVVEG